MGLTRYIFSEKQLLCEESACTGCAACAASCSQKCIALIPDSEGFLRPVIDFSRCTGCKCCSRACPILIPKIPDAEIYCATEPCSGDSYTGNENEDLTYPVVYAAWHLDEDIRKSSSSGGVFTALAEHVLIQGGMVAGAAFDDSIVVRHIIIDKSSDIYLLRGSKYVQSEIEPALLCSIRDLLEQGCQILFSGTPCEVAGLLSFLHKSYDNLFCCDLICHGVPSPKLFDCYVKHIESKHERLVDFTFRDKTKGWKKYGIRQKMEGGKSRYVSASAHPYMTAFLRDYALRPSCYECRYKEISRVGDLTIADFWGVSEPYPKYDLEDKGTSLVLVNNEKGKVLLDQCKLKIFLGTADLNTAKLGNPGLIRACSRPIQRDSFYIDLNKLPFKEIIRKYQLHSSLFNRIIKKCKQYVISVLRIIRKK